jgi:hypothetical protein
MRAAEHSGMRLLSQHDLAGRGHCGEGIALLRRADRKYLYVANERGPVNFSVLDVTDPTGPVLLSQTTLPHRCVRSNSLAYLSTGTPDSRPTHPLDDQFTVIVDLSRPERPAEAGRWWLPGTQAADGCPPPVRHERFDAGFRAHNVNVYPQRPDRAYVGYLDAGVVILDIADVAAPRLVCRLDYHPPMPGFTHTVLPLFTRNLLAISDETVHDHAADYPKLLWFADASHERSPLIISSAPMPPLAEYAARGGRFGAHNLHENEPFDWSWRGEDIVFGSFFNAGVRAFDVRDPFQPHEVAAFVPPAPHGSDAGAIQINDVYVGADGVVYAVDRGGGGLYILQFEGRTQDS